MSALAEAEIVGRALKGHRNGRGWLARCPSHDDRSPSLSVASGTDGRLLLKCFAGCAGADVLAELRALGILESKRQSPMEKAEIARRVEAALAGRVGTNQHSERVGNALPTLERGKSADLAAEAEEADRQRRIDSAIDIYNGTDDIRGTLGERYLVEHRGITVTTDPDADFYLFDRLRFHAACPFKGGTAPAIVVPVTGPKGYLRGIWRIRLDPDGQKVERKGLGDCRGGAVQLVPALDEDHIAVAEGIEDALAWSQMTGQPTWAGCSTSGVAGMVLPPRFRRVTIVADADEAGIKAARTLVSRLTAEGRMVQAKMPPTGFKDANACLEARP